MKFNYLQPNDYLESTIRKNDLKGVKEAIKDGADLHLTEPQLLFSAIKQGDINIVKVLVENGAMLYNDDDDALRIACSIGNLTMLKILDAHHPDFSLSGKECLEYAISNDNIEVVKYLVEKLDNNPNIGYNLNIRKDSPLSCAALRNKLEIAQYLISKGSDISQTGYEAIKYAIHNDHLEMTQYFSTLINIIEVVEENNMTLKDGKIKAWINSKKLNDKLNDDLCNNTVNSAVNRKIKVKI
jgi:ankyrin repeat protein